MKCFEKTKCSEKERSGCYVYNTFKSDLSQMENVKCWIYKGAYQQENRAQLQRCHKCSYFLDSNYSTGISAQTETDVAIVSLQGAINNDRTRALEKVWEKIKQNGRYKLLVDISNVTNIYSCGLGLLVKIHKETLSKNGLTILVGASGAALAILTETKLTKVIKLSEDRKAALEYFETIRKKEEPKPVEKVETPAPVETPPPVKKWIPCWEFWKNQNPRNATKCDECYRKITPSKDHCWQIEGMIEGVAFQYVNEECESCDYFLQYCNVPIKV